MTRRSGSSLGCSAPVASATRSRRASSSVSACFKARRVVRVSAALWMNGSASASGAGPIAPIAADTARSSPTRSAVVTSNCARSAPICAWRGRRVGATEPADRSRGVGKDREGGGHRGSRARCRPRASERPTARGPRPERRSPRPRRPQSRSARASRRRGSRPPPPFPRRPPGAPAARSLGEECQEGFVLDLLEPAEREARRLVAVPEVRPGRIQQLPVPGVASIHLDLQGATVEGRRLHHRDTACSERSVLHRVRLDPKVEECRHHLLGRRTSPGRTEDEMHEGCRAVSDRQTGDDTDRRGDAEGDGRERRQGDEPSSRSAGPVAPDVGSSSRSPRPPTQGGSRGRSAAVPKRSSRPARLAPLRIRRAPAAARQGDREEADP